LEAKLKTHGFLRDRSTVERLDHFTRLLGRVTRTSEIKVFCYILCFSTIVTSVVDFNKVLEKEQVRYLSKLGGYVRILRQMPLFLKKAGKVNITIEQVLT
jgi:ribosomal protein L17